MEYIVNGFSPKMLDINKNNKPLIRFIKITEKEFNDVKGDAVSVIGHEGLANYLDVPMNRFNIQLKKDDIAYIVQTRDGRHNAFDKSNHEITYTMVKILV